MRIGLGAGMRPFLLCVTFLLLGCCLILCWQHRYRGTLLSSELRMEDLVRGTELPQGVTLTNEGNDTTLTVAANPAGGHAALRLLIPVDTPGPAILLTFRLKAKNLEPGNQVWENGRAIIEWHQPHTVAPGDWESVPVSSVRFDDESQIAGFVVHTASARAVPALRLENLGKSGTMELSGFRARMVEESTGWRIGKWLLLSGFLAWAAALVFACKRVHLGRALGAAAIWVAMGINFAVPGPWKIQRPFIQPFHLGEPTVSAKSSQAALDAAPIAPSTLPPAGSIQATGNIPLQGSFPLRVKFLISSARPVLHALMLALPAFLLTALAGRRAALYLCGLLTAFIELSQWAYGYGFGWDDVGDICMDVVGIALGLYFCLWCRKRMEKSAWNPFWKPNQSGI